MDGSATARISQAFPRVLTTQRPSRSVDTGARHRRRRRLERASDVFLGAREELHEIEEHLRSTAAFAADHAELETYVWQHGREV